MASKKKPLGKPPSQRPRDRHADPNDIRFVAVHEAGHAVAAVVLGLPLRGVDVHRRTLADGQRSVGFTDCPVNPKVLDVESLMPFMVQAMSGPAAELRVNPAAGETGALAADVDDLRQLAAQAVCNAVDTEPGRRVIAPAEIRRNQRRIDELILGAIEKAEALVTSRWDAITVTAYHLCHRKGLTGEDVAALVAAWPVAGKEAEEPAKPDA